MVAYQGQVGFENVETVGSGRMSSKGDEATPGPRTCSHNGGANPSEQSSPL